MPITFASQPLLVPTPEITSWWDSLLNCKEALLIRSEGFGSSGICDLQSNAAASPDKEVRLNTLYWPQGASRFSVFYGLVDNVNLERIRLSVGPQNYPRTFAMQDEAGGQISTAMYFVNAHPLAQIPKNLAAPDAQNMAYTDPRQPVPVGILATINSLKAEDVERQLYLITLVDVRYFWWLKTGSFAPLPATWKGLLDLAASTLDENTFTVTETLETEYKTPSLIWRQVERPAPLLIDSACTVLNRRFIRKLNGVCEIQSWVKGKERTYTQLDANAAKKMAGGEFYLDDLSRIVPELVRCIFTRSDATVYTKDVTLSSLGITEYNGFSGMPGMHAKYYSELNFIDNYSDADNLARKAAKGWYGMQLPPTDICYAGIINWESNAYTDAVLWEYTLGKITTRVTREPFQFIPAEGAFCPPETQIVKINRSVKNADGDFEGVIQLWDKDANAWKDSVDLVWVKDSNK